MSIKRPFDELQLISNPSTNESPTKKQKINHFRTQSICFPNIIDHKLFTEILSNINDSQLSEQLNISYFINKEIAEYANGQFVLCNGDINCTNDISILNEHVQIYNNNNNYEHIIGYKYCIESHKYYCFECMNKTKICDFGCECCQKLYFKPKNINKCNICLENICICDCDCDCNQLNECNNCDFVSCNECIGVDECVQCGEWFCEFCSITINKWDNEIPLLYKSNTELFKHNFGNIQNNILICVKCAGKWYTNAL